MVYHYQCEGCARPIFTDDPGASWHPCPFCSATLVVPADRANQPLKLETPTGTPKAPTAYPGDQRKHRRIIRPAPNSRAI